MFNPHRFDRSSCTYHFWLWLTLTHSFSTVLSASCYYDSFSGRTICDGLSYGARLAIAAVVTVVGAAAFGALSYFIRRKYYASQGPPPISAGYYGPPPAQYPPTAAYAQPQFYPAPVPTYDQNAPPPPGYNPHFHPPPPNVPPKHPQDQIPPGPPV